MAVLKKNLEIDMLVFGSSGRPTRCVEHNIVVTIKQALPRHQENRRKHSPQQRIYGTHTRKTCMYYFAGFCRILHDDRPPDVGRVNPDKNISLRRVLVIAVYK